MTFRDDSSHSDEYQGLQDGGNFDYDPTFEASSSLYEPHLLTQGDLNELVRDLKLSEKATPPTQRTLRDTHPRGNK